MLCICGACLSYSGINMGEIKDSDMKKDRTHIFIAAALYLCFVIGCGIRWGFLQHVKKTNPYHPGLQ